jgi:glycosyltransferase involved in cell wall biosynthesis
MARANQMNMAPFTLVMTGGTHSSGLQTVFASLALRFQEKGIPTTIFVGPGEQRLGLRNQLEDIGCKVVTDAVFSMDSTTTRRKAAEIILANIRTRCVVLLGFSIRSAMVFYHVSKECKNRGIESFSSIQVYSLQHQSWLWLMFYLLGVRLYQICIDHLFAACKIEKDKMIKLGFPSSRCSIVHLPIDDEWTFKIDELSHADTNNFQLSWLSQCSHPRIIFLGNFTPIKGQKTLIKMMPYVLTRFPSAVLILAGEGPYKSKCQQLAQSLGVDKSVIFPGRLPQSQIPPLLRQCDIAAVASRSETFGYCIAEPLLYGVPVVSTYTGVAGELSDIGAIEIFKKNSPYDAAKVIIKCLNEPEKTKKRCALGKEYVLQNCLANSISAQMLSSWETLLKKT